MKKVISAILMVAIVAGICTNSVQAASQAIIVETIKFPVTINGIRLDDSYLNWLTDIERNPEIKYYNEYPLLLYKGITYIPMTWFMGKLLNLKTSWSHETGLEISQEDPSVWKNYSREYRQTKNETRYNASIVNNPVVVNGKYIDNKNEPYPLFLFRGVTYFPLTWRFAVDEFKWRYSYSNEKGLQITANNSFYYYEQLPDVLDKVQYDGNYSAGAHKHVYINGNLKVWKEFHSIDSMFIQFGELYISQGEEVFQVGEPGKDGFGVFQGSFFRVEGNWVYTEYVDLAQNEWATGNDLGQARVNIQTREIEMLVDNTP